MSLPRVSLLLTPLLLLACAETPRCVDRSTSAMCTSTSECSSNQDCVDGRCQRRCAEASECSGEGAVCVDGHCQRPIIECNAGKVPVCGNDPDDLYAPSGALLPVPSFSASPSGSCDGVSGPCRTRPSCEQIGAPVTCASGEAPVCVLGQVTTVAPPRADSGPPPTPDSGPPEEDSGPPEEDAGSADEDAGGGADGG